MGNEVAVIKQDDGGITPADVKKYICPRATDKEIELFLITCKLHNLNPLKREAYLIKYGSDPAQTVVGYETYLKRAEATGQLDGWECVMIGNDSAQITIHRKDRKHPFVWTVDRKEFDKGRAMWKSMPSHMTKKIAISQGFRLCFPETLGGMPYTQEEMVDAIDVTSEPVESLPEPIDFPPEETYHEMNTTVCKKDTPIFTEEDEVNLQEKIEKAKSPRQEKNEQIEKDNVTRDKMIKQAYAMLKKVYPDKDSEELRKPLQDRTGQRSFKNLTKKELEDLIILLEGELENIKDGGVNA